MPRLNFTGRRKISRSHVTIVVTGIGGIETFTAELQLDRYGFPATAAVIVEAYRQLELLRFDFGTVGKLNAPASCRLSEFGTLNGLRFRVKVVSAGEPRGRLLAVADRINPRNQQQQSLARVPLLAVSQKRCQEPKTPNCWKRFLTGHRQISRLIIRKPFVCWDLVDVDSKSQKRQPSVC